MSSQPKAPGGAAPPEFASKLNSSLLMSKEETLDTGHGTLVVPAAGRDYALTTWPREVAPQQL